MLSVILSFISGVLTAFSFTKESFAPFIFVSLVPFFLSMLKAKKRREFYRSSVVFYFVYCIITFSWVFELKEFIDVSDGSKYLILAISLLIMAAVTTFRMMLAQLFYFRIKTGNYSDIVKFSFIFITGEWIQEHILFLPFPWARLGIIASPFTTFIQSASVFGSLFISFLIVMINGSIAFIILNYKQASKAVAASICILILITANMSFGILSLLRTYSQERYINVCLVQGNFSDINKWEATSEDTLYQYLSLTEEAITPQTDIVFWPETAIPTYINRSDIANKITDYTRKENILLITGAFYDKTSNNSTENFNSIYIADKNGKINHVYSKQYLVPFGEMFPLYNMISKMPVFDTLFSDRIIYSPGKDSGCVDTDYGRFAAVICYESIFPSCTRSSVKDGAEFIVVLSNDSWFGNSHAIYQHYSNSIMRAVENRRYLVRCANTAVTAIIDSNGREVVSAPYYEPYAINSTIVLNSQKSIYTYIGDVIVIPGMIFGAYGLFKYVRFKISEHKKKKSS